MRKIWNHAPYPVWSLASKDEKGKSNMNICTYVVPISMKPKEFMVALYYGTQTYENIKNTRSGCLQLLAHDQFTVVRKLGKQSQKTTPSKLDTLYKKNMVTTYKNWEVLRNTIGWITLEFYDIQETSADHAIGCARIIHHESLRDEEVLTTKILYDKKIIG